MPDTQWIAFLRGVNVGGKNKLPMKQLAELLESQKLSDVSTYIQSGNVVFTAKGDRARLTKKIRNVVGEHFGFDPEVLLLTLSELNTVREANPFPDAEPSKVYCFLVGEAYSVDNDAVEQIRAKTEEVVFTDTAAFLHAPEGTGRSKLGAKMERLLGTPATARNMNTIEKVARLAGE